MKFRLSTLALASVFAATTSVNAGPIAEAPEPAPILDPFADVIRPITAPTLFDLAIPRTTIHPIFMTQNLSNSFDTTLGKLPVGGDFQLYALQAELAITERFSLTAMKDGYIDFNPDETLTSTDGWANIGLGMKYAFLYRPEHGYVRSANIQLEVPTGNDKVWQGNGDSAAILGMSGLTMIGKLQLSDSFNFHIPFNNNEESTTFHAGVHLSYPLTERISPLVEFNYFRVLDAGDGGSRFNDQVGGAVPSVIQFEGGDLVNFGASNARDNADLFTFGAGLRFKLFEGVNLGAAYEIPLTDESSNLMKSRVTVDCVIRF